MKPNTARAFLWISVGLSFLSKKDGPFDPQQLLGHLCGIAIGFFAAALIFSKAEPK